MYKVDMRGLDKHALACLAAFLALSGAVVAFKIKNTTGLRLVSPLLVWPAASLLVGTRFGAWLAGMAKYSFFIFLMHAPVLMAGWMLYSRYGAAVPYPIFWVLAPLLTTALLMGLYHLCRANFPIAFALARGVSPRRTELVKESAALNR